MIKNMSNTEEMEKFFDIVQMPFIKPIRATVLSMLWQFCYFAIGKNTVIPNIKLND